MVEPPKGSSPLPLQFTYWVGGLMVEHLKVRVYLLGGGLMVEPACASSDGGDGGPYGRAINPLWSSLLP